MCTNKFWVFFVFSLFFSSCSVAPQYQLIEMGKNTRTYDETIRINNCGGEADSEQTKIRSFGTSIDFELEISAGYHSIIEGSLSAKYNEFQGTSISQKVIASPHTDMEVTLRWIENIRSGNVTIDGKKGNYEVRVPIAVEQVASQNKGCPSPEIRANPTNTKESNDSKSSSSYNQLSLTIKDLTNNQSYSFQLPFMGGTSSCTGPYLETGATTNDYQFNIPETWGIIIDSWKAEWSSGNYSDNGIVIISGNWQGNIKINTGAICAFPIDSLQQNLQIRRTLSGNDGRLEYRIPSPEMTCPSLSAAYIEQLKNSANVTTAISQAEEFAKNRQNDYQTGTQIPKNVVIATNLYGNPSKFPVNAIKNEGGWGLFLTTESFIAPNAGTYWCIQP